MSARKPWLLPVLLLAMAALALPLAKFPVNSVPSLRLIKVPIRDAGDMAMDEALICLRERSRGKLVQAFLEIARAFAKG